jgi:hypothetical protein
VSKSKNLSPASTAEVRAWAVENEQAVVDAGLPTAFLNPPSGKVRGRVPAGVGTLFTEATGRPYAEKSVAEQRSVMLPLTKPNARGARLKRPEAFPISEVRALAGAPSRGRLSSKHIAIAAERVQEQRGW